MTGHVLQAVSNVLLADGNKWNPLKFLTNTKNWLITAGLLVLAIVGAGMVLYALINIGRKLMGSQEVRQGWVMLIGALVFGAVLLFMDLQMWTSLTEGLRSTVDDLGQNTALLFPF